MITVSTHGRAEAAAGNLAVRILAFGVSTHSRTEAAAPSETDNALIGASFNTQPRGGGCRLDRFFQQNSTVSTHSRAEAADSVIYTRNYDS